MAQQKRDELKKRLQQNPKKHVSGKDIRPRSGESGGFGTFITKSGKILVIAAPIIVGIVVWRYFYHFKDSLTV